MDFVKHHKNYSIYSSESNPFLYQYSNGIIKSIQYIPDKDSPENTIIIQYNSEESYKWKSKYIDSYITQFGIAVSNDGAKLFVQTWEKGLLCFDARTGEQIWKTKSRKGITNIFVNDDTITVQLHDYAMQLLDMNTGEVIKEKRPSTAWGFTALNNQYIICQVTARKWELIEAHSLEAKETFTHKEFSDNHTDYCINHISLIENGIICVRGFQNVWDKSKNPPVRLPNLEFENHIESKVLS